MNKVLKLTVPVLVALLVVACGGRTYEKSPVDEYIIKYATEQNFAIILQDMTVEGTFFKTYKHQYKVILEDAEGTPSETVSDWKEIHEDVFWANENNLGMTLCHKKDGKLDKHVSPPGYQYVGNNKYGEWRTQNGSSFWAFYGQYMFMSHMFGMMNRPIYQREYSNYRTSHYGRSGYYGPTQGTGKGSKYGTNSAGTRKARPDFFQRKASSSGWSGGRSRSGGFGSRGSGFGK